MRKERRILIVDDDILAGSAVRAPLVRKGYHVDLMTTGEEALEWLRTNTPDLIILDVVMPGFDGLEVCRRVRANAKTRHVHVIFLTGKGSTEDIAKGREAGSDLYLVKPVPAARVIALVEMLDPQDAPPLKKTRKTRHR